MKTGKKIDPTWIIDKNEAFFINSITKTKAYVGELYAQSGQKAEYAKVIAYCDMLQEAVQDLTDKFTEVE